MGFEAKDAEAPCCSGEPCQTAGVLKDEAPTGQGAQRDELAVAVQEGAVKQGDCGCGCCGCGCE